MEHPQSIEELAAQGGAAPGQDTAQIAIREQQPPLGECPRAPLEVVHWHARPKTPCGIAFKRELPRTSLYEEVTCPQCAAQLVGTILKIPKAEIPREFPIKPTPILPERTPAYKHPAVTTVGEFLKGK